MADGRPHTRQSARQGRQRSYCVVTPLPEELIGGAPSLASTTNPHAPLPGYCYGGASHPEQPHTKLVSLLEAGWMLDAWDKLPPPEQAPYVDAALAEMGHDTGAAAGRPCAAPASPPPQPRARLAAACAAESAAAAPALGLPGRGGTGMAGTRAISAPEAGDAAGGLLALSLLGSVPLAVYPGNVQAPPGICCAAAACQSHGSSTGSGGSTATQLCAAGRVACHSSSISVSSPACAAGIGEAAGAEDVQHVASGAERLGWQPHWQQQQLGAWEWPPWLPHADPTGGPGLALHLQVLLEWQRQQPQQEQPGSVQQQPLAQPQPPESVSQQQQQQQPGLHSLPACLASAAAQPAVAAEAPRAPSRTVEESPRKRPALQTAAQAARRLCLPSATAEVLVGEAAAAVPSADEQSACASDGPRLQQQQSGCSSLTRPGSAGPSGSGPAASGDGDDDADMDDSGVGDATATAAALEEGAEEEGGDDGGRKRERKRDPPRYRVKDVTLEVLQREGCFSMTQVEAARHLGFGSPTSIKAIMKRLGIVKWPYRKKSTIGKMLGNMEEFVRRYCDPGIVDKVLLRAREAHRELELYEKCTTGAAPPLAEELRALRQKVYKLKDQDRHGQSEDSMRRCVAQLVGKVMSDAAAVNGA